MKLGFALKTIVVVAVLLLGGVVNAETALERTVAEGGADWLTGNWAAVSDEGEKATLSYSWQVKKNMIRVCFEMGDYSYQGMIYCLGDEQRVVEIGIDSEGGIVKSEWESGWDGIISTRRTRQMDGQTREMGILSSKIDSDTMQMKVYGLVYGALSNELMGTLEFKRQPVQGKSL